MDEDAGPLPGTGAPGTPSAVGALGGESAQVREDRDGVLNACIGFAQRLLEDHGEFPPFGVLLGADGYGLQTSTRPGQGPAATELLVEEVGAALRQVQAGRGARCAAVVCDVLVSDEGSESGGGEHDAVCMDIEHVGGGAVRALLRYRVQDGVVTFGRLDLGPGTARVFSCADPSVAPG